MSEHRDSPSPGEVAMEVASYSVGLGILTMALFPFSLVGLLLFVIAPIAILLAPLVLVPLAVLLLAAPFVLLFRGARSLMARRAPGGTLTGRTAARPCS